MEVRPCSMSARVTLATDYRVATLTLVGGEGGLISRATLDDLAAALAVAARNPGLDVLVLRGDRPGSSVPELNSANTRPTRLKPLPSPRRVSELRPSWRNERDHRRRH